jgi:ankyrin repeat protein
MRTIALVTALVLVGACGHVAVSPLAAAARAGDLTEIDRLLVSGADINAGSGVNNWPPVIHAVHKGQVKALERLLDRGASLDGGIGRRALDMASSYGDDAMARVLVAHRVQPKAGTLAVAVMGPLDVDYTWSGCDRHTAVARTLLAANPTLQLGHTPRGWVVRQSARVRGCDDLVKMLP